MKVYITYDMYEHAEWFDIYQVTTKMSEVKKDYKKNLFEFLSYGPDDCHSYQIQIVDLTEEEYKLLSSQVGKVINSTNKEVVYELMERISDDCLWCQYDDTNCLLCTDGSTDIDNLGDSLRTQGLDDDEIEQIYNDEDQYKKQLKKYIDKVYIL